jgi:hypothetical protein
LREEEVDRRADAPLVFFLLQLLGAAGPSLASGFRSVLLSSRELHADDSFFFFFFFFFHFYYDFFFSYIFLSLSFSWVPPTRNGQIAVSVNRFDRRPGTEPFHHQRLFCFISPSSFFFFFPSFFFLYNSSSSFLFSFFPPFIIIFFFFSFYSAFLFFFLLSPLSPFFFFFFFAEFRRIASCGAPFFLPVRILYNMLYMCVCSDAAGRHTSSTLNGWEIRRDENRISTPSRSFFSCGML